MRHVKALAGLAVLCSAVASPSARADDADAVMSQYFRIWSDNRTITPQAVGSMYARRVEYYGRVMTQDEVYRDKLNLVQRWPERAYHAVPGTVDKRCDAAKSRCSLRVLLTWQARNEQRGTATHGQAVITMALASQDGVLKIVRESQTPALRQTR